jgi:FtsP/CotA-like multicopper oxidase with cupredoxin domain
MGPSWLQIGTEGGFLPKLVERKPQPVTWRLDPAQFWFFTVKDTSLGLMPAERADVIVDFTGLEGETLIVYNDAPAAWPAGDTRYDYYTGAPDQRDTGGYGIDTWNPDTSTWEASGPLPGKGPNTRTIMQIKVRTTPPNPAYNFSRAALEQEFVPPSKTTPGLFERAQEPIIVGQTAYKDVYPNSYFPPNYPWQGIAKIQDNAINFMTVSGKPVIATLEPKAMHDEMGASFDPEYGRMAANLGMQTPNPTTLTALAILYGYSDVPSELITNSIGFNISVLPNNAVPGTYTLADGTQIWKISHNGVDTHPIHFHVFDVQVINRVGWDGLIALPDPNELGWKDTVKVSPLMDTIVAMRPVAPTLPFGLPNSLRPLNPAIPVNSPMGFSQIDWTTGQAWGPTSQYPLGISNFIHDFKWEYVWHCHILGHEEMDMMRSIELSVASNVSAAPALTGVSTKGVLSWTDPTPVNYVTQAGFGNPASEIGFRVERCDGTCTATGTFVEIKKTLANATTYRDATVIPQITYSYRVIAYNAAGDSAASNIVTVTTFPRPIVTTTSPMPVGTVGVLYNRTLTASSGSGTYTTWSVSSGTLPAGLGLNPSTGVISGTPTTSGTNTFFVQVQDSDGVMSTPKSLSITVGNVPTAPPANFRVITTTQTAITLGWNTNTALYVQGFMIERAPNIVIGGVNTPGTFVQVTAAPAATATRYTNSSSVASPIVANTKYWYRIRAYNAYGTSAYATPSIMATTLP